MFRNLFPYRFEILFFSQLIILFGSLLFPTQLYEEYLKSILLILNLLAGVLLFSTSRLKMGFVIILLAVAMFSFGVDLTKIKNIDAYSFIHLGTFFLFYILLTIELILQVWSAKKVGKNVILGLISGYISLGLLGFFLCMTIEMVTPGSFGGLVDSLVNDNTRVDELLYYSYVTLMTIGYGEIVPITSIARKASILIGLMGQIYLVVLTAIIVGKYINQKMINTED